MIPFSEQDLHDIRDLFGAAPEQLDAEAFPVKLRELRAK